MNVPLGVPISVATREPVTLRVKGTAAVGSPGWIADAGHGRVGYWASPPDTDAPARGAHRVQAFSLDQLFAAHKQTGRLYHEFLRVPALSAGLYVLPAGAADPQQPHAEDEIYHVLRGRARVRVAGEERPIGPGDTIYVAAGVEHRFLEIGEELALLVFFAPAHAPG